jgi:hypothetical protein
MTAEDLSEMVIRHLQDVGCVITPGAADGLAPVLAAAIREVEAAAAARQRATDAAALERAAETADLARMPRVAVVLRHHASQFRAGS